MSLVAKLAKGLNKTEKEIRSFIQDAPKKYRVYKIPKRTSGFRVIAQPTRELKDYQRLFLTVQSFPVHSAAMAYRNGVSIKDNAALHKNSKYLLKMDLENFFNSISNDLFWKVCEDNDLVFSVDDRQVMEKLLFWSHGKTYKRGLALSVGAPSSPSISNFIMHQFDVLVSEYCLSRRIVYSRYADDLTFSTSEKDVLFSIPDKVRKLLNELFEGKIQVNNRKTVFSSKGHNRHVTGITITNDGGLSLGREKKRYIKHLVFQYKINRISEWETKYLKGILAFLRYVEPQYYQSLVKKYSAETMKSIQELNCEK